MRLTRLTALSTLLVGVSLSAQPTVNVGPVDLQPDQAGQQVQVTVSGTESIGGLEFFAQVGDGSSGPVITGVDLLNGTIFEADNFGQFDLGSGPRNAAASTSVFFDAVQADGLLATLTISTEGITGPGRFGLTLSSTLLGGHAVLRSPRRPDHHHHHRWSAENRARTRDRFAAGPAGADAGSAAKVNISPGYRTCSPPRGTIQRHGRVGARRQQTKRVTREVPGARREGATRSRAPLKSVGSSRVCGRRSVATELGRLACRPLDVTLPLPADRRRSRSTRPRTVP